MFGLPEWSDYRLRTKGLIVVAAPAAATVMIAWACHVIGNRVTVAENVFRGALRAGQEIHTLQTSEAEASAYIRAFFIGGDEDYARKAREKIAMFDTARLKLSPLISDSPLQVQHLDKLSAYERSRVELMFNAAALLKAGDLPQESLQAELNAAETDRAQIETLLTQMAEEDGRFLEDRMLEIDRLRSALSGVATICALLGVMGGAMISLLFASGITRRIVLLQDNVSRLAKGRPLHLFPAGRDEIGVLSEGIAITAKTLTLRTRVLENALHGIAEVDASDAYVSFNKSYAALAGFTEGRAASSLVETVHADDRISITDAIQKMRVAGTAELESRIVTPSGNTVTVAITLLPGAENSESYFVFMRDISERKLAEEALVRAKDEALASRAARTKFLAKISHDIRTPLNAILGAADLLAETPLNADQSEYVRMFQRNSRSLVALINDFLDLSKIDAGAVRVERVAFRLREIAGEAVATFRESAHRKSLALQMDIAQTVPEWVLGDPIRVQQVLVNLLSNAIKFTRSGRVYVKLGIAQAADGERVLFDVSDTGPGISPQDQQRIFAAFTQLPDQPGNGAGGCGLGLVICRELVELMGGEIGVTSELGTGSTFRFSLPLATASPDDNDAERIGQVTSKSNGHLRGQTIRILAAEDTEDNRLLLIHYMRGEAVELHFAHNGQEALDAFQRGETFDLVLMDLDMPVMDGFQAARAIRGWQVRGGEPLTPMVGLSAHAFGEAVRECLDSGCVAHLAKPVERSALLDAIRKHARRIVIPPLQNELVDAGVAQLVPAYLASKPKQLEEAKACLAVKDFNAVRRFGHNLKGTGPGYGFPRFAEIGSEIEKAVQGGDELAVIRQLEALDALLVAEQAKTEMENHGPMRHFVSAISEQL